jgi:TDG/mug DNA glycosylase family protein
MQSLLLVPCLRDQRALVEHGIALEDVIVACERDGSLDTAIQPASIQVNDFATHFEARPGFARIAFNGGSAEREYRRRVLPSLPDRQRQLPRVRLPSTSPAHAGMRFEAKLAAWRVVLGWIDDGPGDARRLAPGTD